MSLKIEICLVLVLSLFLNLSHNWTVDCAFLTENESPHHNSSNGCRIVNDEYCIYKPNKGMYYHYHLYPYFKHQSMMKFVRF